MSLMIEILGPNQEHITWGGFEDWWRDYGATTNREFSVAEVASMRATVESNGELHFDDAMFGKITIRNDDVDKYEYVAMEDETFLVIGPIRSNRPLF